MLLAQLVQYVQQVIIALLQVLQQSVLLRTLAQLEVLLQPHVVLLVIIVLQDRTTQPQIYVRKDHFVLQIRVIILHVQ